MTEIIIIVIMSALMALQSYLHSLERKDLYNRLMAKDLTEYKTATQAGRPPPKSRNFVAAGIRRYFERQKAGD